MVVFYIITYGVTITTFLTALVRISRTHTHLLSSTFPADCDSLAASMTWNPILNMCTVTTTSLLLIPAWGAGLIFELTVLVATAWNVFDRPREAHESLTRALHKDGITFFLVSRRALLLLDFWLDANDRS
jgi:hypothetical protein